MNDCQLNECIRSGRTSFAQKKTASLYATAHVYLIWQATAQAHAPQQARTWLRDKLTEANAVVSAHNKSLKGDRKRGKDVLAGKLTEADLAREGAANPETEKSRLIEVAELADDVFNARLRVAAKFKEDDDEISCNAVVRFVFELYDRHDAPLVSRYSKVLGSIGAALGHEPNLDAQKIVDWLNEAGGFEAVLHASREQSSGRRGSDEKSVDKSEAKSATKKVDKIGGEVLEEFRADTLMVTLRMPSWISDLPEGSFSLYCSYRGPEDFEVIGFDPLDEAELTTLESRFRGGFPEITDAGSTVPSDAEQAFVSEVVE
ncbi:MAG: hypothetical protein GC204_09340 [Chloroflexi bacterium]|nr:hypothetical protein [Chloroflexota bacterium]